MDNNVGKITIGTEVDTKGIDKGLVDIERKVTSKGFMNKFSRIFGGVFSKVSSGASKITSSIGKGLNTILKGLGSITSTIGGIAGIIAKISLIGIIGMILLAVNYSETSKAQLQEIATIVLNLADVLAKLILPVAEAIVNLIYEGVKWIAELLNGWFGIDLFAKRTDKSLKSGVKSAKALRKQLLGFDEMNILNKDGSIGGLGSGGTTTSGGSTNPKTNASFGNTLARIGEIAQETIKKKLLLSLGPGGILLGLLFGDVKVSSKMTDKVLQKLKKKFLGAKATFKDGIVEVKTTTGETIKYSYSEYEKLMRELGYTTDTTTGQIKESFVGANKVIVDNGITASSEFSKNWVQAGVDIAEKFTGTDGVLGEVTTSTETSMKAMMGNIENIIKYYKLPVVEISVEEDKNKNTKSALDKIEEIINNYNIPVVNVDVEEDKDKNSKGLMSGIKETIKGVSTTVSIKADTLPFINEVKKLAKASPVLFMPIVDALRKVGYKLAKGGIITIPKLASGGVINRPGKGVPLAYGGAIGGERGREAVIPLTDSQQMSLLGREIAKNVVIQLTNVTELDGRVLARTTAQVMSDMNFASNGGAL